jgi:hypothetical protein
MMSPRTSAVSRIQTLQHLEPYLGARIEHLEVLAAGLENFRFIERFTVARGAKRREITVPTDESLKNVHRRMLSLLTAISFDFPTHVTGYVRGRSTYSNALPHVGRPFLQRFDLKDFFDHVSAESVVAGLSAYGFHGNIATMLARLATVRRALPTGFATSPSMANASMAFFDASLFRLAQDRELSVTRYADDIVFSGLAKFDLSMEIDDLCSQHGQELNTGKTRTLKYGQPLYVTGLSVSDAGRPRLPRPFKLDLRRKLHYIQMYGLDSHAAHVGEKADQSRTRLGGQLAYARSIEPDFVTKMSTLFPEAIAQVIRVASAESDEKRSESLRRLATRIMQHPSARATEYVPHATYKNSLNTP